MTNQEIKNIFTNIEKDDKSLNKIILKDLFYLKENNLLKGDVREMFDKYMIDVDIFISLENFNFLIDENIDVTNISIVTFTESDKLSQEIDLYKKYKPSIKENNLLLRVFYGGTIQAFIDGLWIPIQTAIILLNNNFSLAEREVIIKNHHLGDEKNIKFLLQLKKEFNIEEERISLKALKLIQETYKDGLELNQFIFNSLCVENLEKNIEACRMVRASKLMQ